jgi:hypothetical protein
VVVSKVSMFLVSRSLKASPFFGLALSLMLSVLILPTEVQLLHYQQPFKAQPYYELS